MKTILVPIDFSVGSAKVVETASSLASALGSRVILVHVTEPEPQFVGFDAGPLAIAVNVNVNVANEIHAGQKRLDDLKPKFGAADVLTLDVEGSVPEKILGLAHEHAADLIVIGSHGHGALYHLLAGSVTSAVLKSAPCPVLVVPSGRLGTG
jgi:nucleotide-binding universal stress UspA family protein